MPVTEIRLDTLVPDIRAFVDETMNPSGAKDRASPFHLSPCGGCGAPSWQEPCMSCGHYPRASEEEAKSRFQRSNEGARSNVDKARWCAQVRRHGTIAAFHVACFKKSVAYAENIGYRERVDGLYARAQTLTCPEPEAIHDAVVREHRALDGREERLPLVKLGVDLQPRLVPDEGAFERHKRVHSGRDGEGRHYYEERRLARTEDGRFAVFSSCSSWDPNEASQAARQSKARLVSTSSDRLRLIDEIEDWRRNAPRADQLAAIRARGWRAEDDVFATQEGVMILRETAKAIEDVRPGAAVSFRSIAKAHADLIAQKALAQPETRVDLLQATADALAAAELALGSILPGRLPETEIALGGLAQVARAAEFAPSTRSVAKDVLADRRRTGQDAVR